MILEAEHVSKQFTSRRRGEAAVRAVDDVNLSIRQGEIFGLIGQSGAGKTTLARLLLYLTPPTSGRVLFEGTDLATLAGHRRTM